MGERGRRGATLFVSRRGLRIFLSLSIEVLSIARQLVQRVVLAQIDQNSRKKI
jgi:hypothetical protein